MTYWYNSERLTQTRAFLIEAMQDELRHIEDAEAGPMTEDISFGLTARRARVSAYADALAALPRLVVDHPPAFSFAGTPSPAPAFVHTDARIPARFTR